MSERTTPRHTDALKAVEKAVKTEFEESHFLLGFDEYLQQLENNAEAQLRGSGEYLADMFDFYGKNEATGRFKIFDEPTESRSISVIGHDDVQARIYKTLRSFSRQGGNNKLILLHGPNGSAKTSIIHAIMGGIEKYSREPEGAVYTFSWIFPVERYTKGGIGITSPKAGREPIRTYAKLPDEEIACRIPSDMKDHPLLLIPVTERLAFLKKLLGDSKAETLWKQAPQSLTHGQLSHRSKQIVDALLTSYQGDLAQVLMHVQVERFHYSRRYRAGLVTVEPQMHVDAQYQQITLGRGYSSLPSSLQGLNLFNLSGDLVDGNRGLVEYSDLLKRPIDAFKYLLVACETGSVNVGSAIAYLDTVMIGSTNELQLDAFKEFPDFTSFKGRIELIQVPYLLSFSDEARIYENDIQRIADDKHVAPHTAWAIALWSVLSRLKKPNAVNYSSQVGNIVSKLTPLEKARFYDSLEIPSQLSPEEKKMLKSSQQEIRDEYRNVPYYEGRMGASAREIKSILGDAAHDSNFECLSPLGVFKRLDEFVKHVTEHEFLRQEVKDTYHDSHEFIQVVNQEYLSRIDHEVRDSIGLYDLKQWEDFLKKYVLHISLVLKKEKTKNPITGQLEDPDFALIDEFEKIADAPTEPEAKQMFRQNIISQVGVWSLDHPNQPVIYAKVFPDFWRKLEKHYYESQKALLVKMRNALLDYGAEDEAAELARKTVENMKKNQGYCEHCAREVIIYLMRQRY